MMLHTLWVSSNTKMRKFKGWLLKGSRLFKPELDFVYICYDLHDDVIPGDLVWRFYGFNLARRRLLQIDTLVAT
jgi:hypothetical protein